MVSFSDLLAMSQSTTQASALEAEAAQKQKAAKLAEEKKKQVERERREAEIARKQREKYFEEQRLEKEREEKARIRREEREERKRKEQEEQAKQIKSGPKYPSSRASSSSSSKPRTHRPKAHSDSDDDDLAAGAHALTRDEIKARRLQAQKLREFGSSSARKTASVRGSGHGKKLKGGAYNIVDEHPEALAQGPGNIRDRAKASAGKLISLGKVKNEAGSEGRPGRSALEFSAKKTLSGIKSISSTASSASPSPRPTTTTQNRTYAVPSFRSKPASSSAAKKRSLAEVSSSTTPSPPPSKRARTGATSGFTDEIWSLVGKGNRSKYTSMQVYSDEEEDSDDMEAGASDLEKEEMNSARWAIREDKLAEEEEKRREKEKARRKAEKERAGKA